MVKFSQGKNCEKNDTAKGVIAQIQADFYF